MISIPALLALSAVLLWLMLVTASGFRHRPFRRGWGSTLSNRDDPPEPTVTSLRADRAARNMTENLVVFTALAAALMFAGEGTGTQARIGANLFFWARVVYWPGYVLGIPAVRITAWTIAVAGLVVMATALV